MSEMADREPVLLAFCCHYCAYAAADLAGSMRLAYPPNVRVLRLPCTGKIEVNHILAAFERGVDGVLVAGCLEGGCHFLEGNLRARKRIEDLLEETQRQSETLQAQQEELRQTNEERLAANSLPSVDQAAAFAGPHGSVRTSPPSSETECSIWMRAVVEARADTKTSRSPSGVNVTGSASAEC